jgi:hypothetical protein
VGENKHSNEVSKRTSDNVYSIGQTLAVAAVYTGESSAASHAGTDGHAGDDPPGLAEGPVEDTRGVRGPDDLDSDAAGAGAQGADHPVDAGYGDRLAPADGGQVAVDAVVDVWEAVDRLASAASSAQNISFRLLNERNAADGPLLVKVLERVLEYSSAALMVVRLELADELEQEKARRQTPFGGGR